MATPLLSCHITSTHCHLLFNACFVVATFANLLIRHAKVAVLDHWSYAICVNHVTLMQQICMHKYMALCRLQILSCMPTLRELDFVAVSKLDRDTVSVWTKAQHGGRKASLAMS